MKQVVIIGAGPAGLMAAEAALERGACVAIYDAMPSPARKLLMAGKSGLNITHSEDEAIFRSRYTAPDARLAGQKCRVTFYYLLAEHFGKLDHLAAKPAH